MLTVKFHVHLPPNPKKWEELDSDRYDCRKFKEKMSPQVRKKILLRIVILTLATLGLYLVKLKCSQSGINDSKNLKKRRIIHYVSTVNVKKDIIFKKVEKSSVENLSIKETEHKKRLRAAKEAVFAKKALQKIKDEKKDRVKNLSSVIQQYMQRAKDFAKIASDIKNLEGTNRIVLIEDLFDKNHKLALKLEEYFLLSDDNKTSYNFIKLLDSFLDDADLDKLLSKAVETAKESFPKKTHYQNKFDEFKDVYETLVDPIGFLINLYEDDQEFYDYVLSLFNLGNFFTTRFISLYNNKQDLFDRCLQKMQQSFTVDLKLKNTVEEAFKRWKEVYKKLNKNLSLDCRGETFNVIYRLKDHYKDHLVEIGFNDGLNRSLQSNSINADFIRFYFSENKKLLIKLELCLQNPEFISDAVVECEKKITHAKSLKKQALKSLHFEETLNSLESIKPFIEEPLIYDAVSLLVESESFIKLNSKNFYDQEYFSFLKQLQFSEFYMNGKLPNIDIAYYQDFHRFFIRIGDFLEITKSILKL